MKKIIVLFLMILVLSCSITNAQQRQIHVSEAMGLFGKYQASVYDLLLSKGYYKGEKYQGKAYVGYEFFKNETNIGTFQVTIHYTKYGKVDFVGWQEHSIYFLQGQLQREIELESFNCQEATKNAYGRCLTTINDVMVASYDKVGYIITLIYHDDGSNIVMINMGTNNSKTKSINKQHQEKIESSKQSDDNQGLKGTLIFKPSNDVDRLDDKSIAEINDDKIAEDKEELHGDEGGFDVVDQMPEYRGGNDSLFSFIHRNLRYPKNAWDNGIQGTVVIRFCVSKTGKIVTVIVENREVDPELANEAIRVVRMMPDWMPGKQNNVNVAVWYTFPIKFALP